MPATPANALNVSAAGLVGFDGTATFVGSTTTQYNVIVGGSSSDLVANVAPSATSGIPLVSGGSSANPSFTTAVVAGGGTGNTTFTAYSVICAGTTATGAFQNVSGVGTSGQVLTSNGASALPTWQTASIIGAWTDESTSFSAAANNGYFVTGTATATMPASPSQGNVISFAVDTVNILTITANTGQVIRVGSTVSASAGTCASNKRGDAITLVYRSADTAWIAVPGTQGTWTVT